MDPQFEKQLTEEQSEFLFRRALELQEGARRDRSPRDVVAALQELGGEPIYMQQALAELRASTLARPPETPSAGAAKPRRRLLRRVAIWTAALATIGGSSLMLAASRAQEGQRERQMRAVEATMEQIVQRQEFIYGRTGEYVGQVEELGRIAETFPGEIELLGGGDSYLARVAQPWGPWCQVTSTAGEEPETSCGR